MSTPSTSPRFRAIAILAAVLLVVSLSLVVAACGIGTGVGDGGAVSTVGTSDGSETASTDSTEVSGESTESSDDSVTSEASDGESTVSTSTGDGESSSESGSPTSSTAKSSGGSGGSVTTPSTSSGSGSGSVTTATAGQGTMTVNVYFARDEKMAAAGRVITKTQGVGAAAVRALLAGPTAKEKAAGMSTSIPKGTTLLGLNIKNGIATVDLSKEYASGGGSLSMFTRLAQMVFTLTQFPSIKGVSFMLDGKPIDVLGGEGIIIDHPMTRADYEDMSPAILVESPTLGATVKSPVRVTGTANVFEAVFSVNIVDGDGLVIADERVQASSGTGTRGTFDVAITYPAGHAGQGSLIVFEKSAKDGSNVNVVEIPIVLK
jgi:germination protein M